MAEDRSLLAQLLARIHAPKPARTSASEEPAREGLDLEAAAAESDVAKVVNLVLVLALKDQARVLLGPGRDLGNLGVTFTPRTSAMPRKPDWASLPWAASFDPDVYLPVLRRLCVMTGLQPVSGGRGIITLRVGGKKEFSLRVALEQGERGLLAVVEPIEGPALTRDPPSETLELTKTNAPRLPPKDQPTLWEHAVEVLGAQGNADALFSGLEELTYAWALLGEYERALEAARRAAALYGDEDDSPWRQAVGLRLLEEIADNAGDEETTRALNARRMQLVMARGARVDVLDATVSNAFGSLSRARFDVALAALDSAKRLDVECFGAPTSASLLADACAAWVQSRGLGIDERVAALDARARALSLKRAPEQRRTFAGLLARVARRAGMTTDAERYALEALSTRGPWHARFGEYMRLALVLADAGKLADVERALAQARALVPAGITLWPFMRAREALAMARLREEQGRLDEARAHYAHAGRAFMADVDLVERARKLGVDVQFG